VSEMAADENDVTFTRNRIYGAIRIRLPTGGGGR